MAFKSNGTPDLEALLDRLALMEPGGGLEILMAEGGDNGI